MCYLGIGQSAGEGSSHPYSILGANESLLDKPPRKFGTSQSTRSGPSLDILLRGLPKSFQGQFQSNKLTY